MELSGTILLEAENTTNIPELIQDYQQILSYQIPPLVLDQDSPCLMISQQ